ncbi:MAG: hypothetical protein IPP74_06930 [Alphaproteobacteria bacterium]|nr:hypothetical protein [Alphaproteobacteria bacterium]
MNKTTQYIFALVLIFWLCAACAFMKGTYLPSVGYLNMSDDRIFNIELEWGGVNSYPLGAK